MVLTEQQNITRGQKKTGKINRDLNWTEQSCIFNQSVIATVAQLVEQLIRNVSIYLNLPREGLETIGSVVVQ